MNRVGIIGGSFDPPHFGHLDLAKTAHDAFGFSKTLMLLTPDPPHKQHSKLTEYTHRLSMLKLLTQDNPELEICTIESERPGPHYTLETIRLLKERNPDVDEYWLIVGSDTFSQLHTWFRPELVILEAELCIAVRPEFDIDFISALKQIASDEQIEEIKKHLIPMKPKSISSTEIRKQVAQGVRASGMTAESVLDYIFEHKLYIPQ